MCLAKSQIRWFKNPETEGSNQQLDYYSYGMLEHLRGFSYENYKFGFNGMMKDDEIKGIGNSYSTEFRSYDTRISRWLSIDPIRRSSESPFVAFTDNPVYFKDPSGLTAGPPDNPEERKSKYAGQPDITSGAYVLPEVVVQTSQEPATPSNANPVALRDNTSHNIQTYDFGINSYPKNEYRIDGEFLQHSAHATYEASEVIVYQLANSYSYGSDGKFRKKTFYGNQYVDVVNDVKDLNEAMELVGHTWDMVIVLKDAVDVIDEINETKDVFMTGSIGVLIADAGGTILAYFNPASGLIITFGQLVRGTKEYATTMSDVALEKMDKIRNNWGKDLGYLNDPAYLHWQRVYYQYCNCHTNNGPNLILKPSENNK